MNALRSPFPWFGGKRLVARVVWERLGDPAVYCEPFAGSLAVLLGRPGRTDGSLETVNDIDGFLANAWRAILHNPDATAHHADWPVNENDLHARHAWLVAMRQELTQKLEGDPAFFDAKIAGWWLWGIASWIGSGWCSGEGPWMVEDHEDGDRRLGKTGKTGEGVHRQLVYLSGYGQGVTRQLSSAERRGVRRDDITSPDGLREWFRALSERLRYVRVCCGDWKRVITPASMASSIPGVRAVFLDPPYGIEVMRSDDVYAFDDRHIAASVRDWCLTAPADWRIALCGYEGEHEALEDAGWSVFAWVSRGGLQAKKSEGGNRTRERIWFSPACARPVQLDLLTEESL